MSPIIYAIEKIANRHPDKTAVIGEEYSLTYRQLLIEVTKLGVYLEVYRGKIIALLADNCPEWVIIDLAAQRAGAILLPLPVYFTKQQIDHALQSANAEVLIYQTDALPDDFIIPTVSETRSFLNESLNLLGGPFGDAGSLPVGTDKITFTSGSTGTPKGVCLSNQQQFNVANSLISVTGLMAPRHLTALPLSTLLENIAGVYAPLMAGGEVILLPVGQQRLLENLNDRQPQTLILVPELLVALVSAITRGWQPPKSLKFIAVGGSRVAADLIYRARRFGLPVYEGYGLSEAGSVVSLNTVKTDKPGSAGKILPHLKVNIEHAEIVIKNSGFLGYIGDAANADKKLYTGDLAELDERGFLTVKGRKKQLIISSFGRNINPEWVESEIRVNPIIQQCIVVGDARPFCSALIYTQIDNKTVQKHIDMVNQTLPPYAQVLRWHRLAQPISYQQGLLTSNGRPRRAVINQYFANVIDDFYEEENNGILCKNAG
ncbi:MAG: AMP-binding protein [Methylophaga sp.]|nr:AMP-binding protein [Methylophaga sp.]